MAWTCRSHGKVVWLQVLKCHYVEGCHEYQHIGIKCNVWIQIWEQIVDKGRAYWSNDCVDFHEPTKMKRTSIVVSQDQGCLKGSKVEC